ncbi:hypothetical protein LR48_Vigan04g161900 [Vigna angularis]|uniref:Uncharacterized protein n=1 Tax=Phaseolus angularis TaxID=3914 RepID=A0A0L9UFC6_PHAAN|nr:hypothetical protein LR48_Vigan04g161900 [Vigna angularis]
MKKRQTNKSRWTTVDLERWMDCRSRAAARGGSGAVDEDEDIQGKNGGGGSRATEPAAAEGSPIWSDLAMAIWTGGSRATEPATTDGSPIWSGLATWSGLAMAIWSGLAMAIWSGGCSSGGGSSGGGNRGGGSSGGGYTGGSYSCDRGEEWERTEGKNGRARGEKK